MIFAYECWTPFAGGGRLCEINPLCTVLMETKTIHVLLALLAYLK